MQIIPVIDLKSGHVVHAKQGQRAHYQPIQSHLSPSSHVHDIVAGLLALYPFQTVYIADIDAIQGHGSHTEIITALCGNHPHITWWVDSGNRPQNGMLNRRMVLGSESIANVQEYDTLHKKTNGEFILSLDSMNGLPLGLPELHTQPALWPKHVICMALNAVGSNQGADLPRIRSLQSLNPETAVYAAGGVRHSADLMQMKAQGVAGALVATALHKGYITNADIRQFDEQ